jgi:hypothetical protein
VVLGVGVGLIVVVDIGGCGPLLVVVVTWQHGLVLGGRHCVELVVVTQRLVVNKFT